MRSFAQTTVLAVTAASFALASAESYGFFWCIKKIVCCIVSIVLCGSSCNGSGYPE
jgi:hypothetical protein